VLLGDMGLHGVPGGAESVAVGAAEPAGAQVFRFDMVLNTATGCSLQE
jgi:hypothetical protein